MNFALTSMGSFLADFKKGAYVAVFFIFKGRSYQDLCRKDIRVAGGGGVFIQYIIASLYD